MVTKASRLVFLALAAGAFGSVCAAPPLDAAPYRLVRSIALGAGERWDYATYDAASDRVFVAHGDHVTVVDVAKAEAIAQIGTFPGGTHGIGIAGDSGRGYTDDGKAGQVVAFDLASLKPGKVLAGAEDADGIAYDPASGHVFVINGDNKSITVVDPKANAVVQTIDVGSALEAAVADGKGKLFVDGVSAHDIVVIDTRRNAVIAHYPMDGCERPHGIAVDASARRVFATCINKVMVVVDADNGRNVASVPIGEGSDGAAFDPQRKWIVSSNNEGTLSVIAETDADHYVSLATVPTASSARTIAIDARSGRLFLPAATVASVEAPSKPGARAHVTYEAGSLKLLVLEPDPAFHLPGGH